jgi:Protein of unknown function (DUF3667)
MFVPKDAAKVIELLENQCLCAKGAVIFCAARFAQYIYGIISKRHFLMSVICKNCAQEFEGKYCPRCGQKASVKRITTKIVFKDALNKLLPWDKGLLFTTRRLLFSPASMVNEYLAGKRVDYTKPFSYLFLVIAVSLIFFSPEDFDNLQTPQSGSDEARALQLNVSSWVVNHLSIVMLGLIPFLSLFSRLFYRKADYNYAEHFIFNCYLSAACTVVSLPLTMLLKAFGQNPSAPLFLTLSMVIYLLYFAWAYVGFFKPRNVWWGGFKAILGYLLAYLTYVILMSILVGIGVVVYFKLFK